MILRKYLIVIYLAFFVCFTVNAAPNKIGYVVGTVDFTALVMLHPNMADYDVEKSAFKVIRPKTDPAGKAQLELLANELKSLKEREKYLDRKLEELRVQTEKSYEEIKQRYYYNVTAPEIATGTRINEEKKFENEVNELNSDNDKQELAIQTELADVRIKIGKIESSTEIELYTTVEETEKKIASIVSEIKKTIKKVAEKNEISVVLNSSSERMVKSVILKQNSPSNIGQLSYNGILNSDSVPNMLSVTKSNPEVKEYNSFYQDVRFWLSKEKEVLGNNYHFVPTGNVILGGKDITKDVLWALFKEYRVRDDTAKSIIDALY